jgi:hypothetical protein
MNFLELEAGFEGPYENLIIHNIPFQVVRGASCVLPIPYWKTIPVNTQVHALFFLGMTTQARSGETGWTGERFYAYQRKLYLGDVIGRIDLLYEGNQIDAIPLIFGVNVWNYETFTPVQAHEPPVFPLFGPYREPLDSDPEATALFQQSLLLRENERGEKYTRYIFALHTRDRKLEWVKVRPFGGRDAGVGISAITALLDPGITEDGWRFTDQNYYVQKRYYPSLDRLARRLYQFLDELPTSFPLELPVGYTGPRIEFHGIPEAELLANVYSHNIHDMATQKVLPDGQMHTSTLNAPCYGFYEGIGTYSRNHNYYAQIWSRDIGRLLCELIEHGETSRCVQAADRFLHYLYDPSPIFNRPHWKRIVNASELGIFPENYEGISFQEYVNGRENDGHASVMLMLYRLYQHGCVDVAYLRAHRRELEDAAEWFCWQMDTPEVSGFDKVLCSESESTYETLGGYDLFSNAYACAALRVFSRLACAMGDDPLAVRWLGYADRLRSGMEQLFIGTHPRYGKVWCEPESDNWPSELKRLASLLLMPEMEGYDPIQLAPEEAEIWINTYRAQKEIFFSPMVGGSMGYGQGYTTQTALLLDQVEDYTESLKWAARFSYHHNEYPYLVPEGVTYHPSGRFWYRHTDLGNAVQQTEIVKCVRLVLGLDDLQPAAGLRLIPRLGDGWQRLSACSYPAVVMNGSNVERVLVDWTYIRLDDGSYEATLKAERPIKVASLRFGPFPLKTKSVRITGAPQAVLQRRGSRLFAYVELDSDTDYLQATAVGEAL